MFIYFPEFLYRKSKTYIKNISESKKIITTYENSLDLLISESLSINKNVNKNKKNPKTFNESSFSFDFNNFPLKNFQENLSNIIDDKIDLPTLEFQACNKFNDFDTQPISDYNFSNNKINICYDKISSNLIKAEINGSKITKNSLIDNKENFTRNKIRYFEALFLKEFSYFYEINKNYSMKKITLNDKAKLSINACRYEIMHRYPLAKGRKEFSNKAENLFYDELIRRCAYNEFKYKFNDDLEFEASNSDENINELVRKYINANYL